MTLKAASLVPLLLLLLLVLVLTSPTSSTSSPSPTTEPSSLETSPTTTSRSLDEDKSSTSSTSPSSPSQASPSTSTDSILSSLLQLESLRISRRRHRRRRQHASFNTNTLASIASNPATGQALNAALKAAGSNPQAAQLLSQAKTAANSPQGKALIAKAQAQVASGKPLVGEIRKFVRKELVKRAPPKEGRDVNPDYDKLDMPQKCPQRCNGHGRCLIDRSRLLPQGRVEIHPYKCHCEPDWAGVACQTRVDQFLKWFESNGVTEFPQCCPVCPTQFANPTNFEDLPVYQNPYSATNCDPQLSIDSRPDPDGRPPCWRPLSAEPIKESSEESSEDAEESFEVPQQTSSTFVEVDTRASAVSELLDSRRRRRRHHRAHADAEFNTNAALSLAKQAATAAASPDGQAKLKALAMSEAKKAAGKAKTMAVNKAKTQAQKTLKAAKDAANQPPSERSQDEADRLEAAAKAAKAKALAEQQRRNKHPVPACCIYCDFDFWVQANSRPASPRPSGRGMAYIHQLERQRIMERFGSETLMREMRRRELVREAQENAFAGSATDDAESSSEGSAPSSPFLFLLELKSQLRLVTRARDQATVTTARATYDAEKRWERLRERDSVRANRRTGDAAQTDPATGLGRAPCCSVCPVAANDPEGVDMQNPTKEAKLTEERNRFGPFLKRRQRRQVRECCNHCPSQFWIRTISQDLDPFWGKEAVLPDKVEQTQPDNPTQGANSEESSATQ